MLYVTIPPSFDLSNQMNSSPPLSRHSFLKGVYAIEVVDRTPMTTAQVEPVEQHLIERVAEACIAKGLPTIRQTEEDEPDFVAMAVPVYRHEEIVSLVVFVGDATDSMVGVFEVWQPIGNYDEMNLTAGYYSKLDRFQNVSSFVRFEKGSGLPGQVWQNLCYVVHDHLPSHTGFLRAAGASAESLQVAVGMPVSQDEFLAAAVLISSDASPVARGYEVWRNTDEGLLLESVAYQQIHDSMTFAVGDRMEAPDTLPSLAVEAGMAVVTEDPEVIHLGRKQDDLDAPPKLTCGVAIPFFEGDRVTNVLTLLM